MCSGPCLRAVNWRLTATELCRLPMFLPLLSGYYVNTSRRQTACLTFGGRIGILMHESQIHLPPGVTHPHWTHGKGAWCVAHWLSLEPRMRGLPHPRSKTMTYEAKLAAQEILALPDRELLQPLTIVAPIQLTATANLNAVAADNGGDASGQQANPVNSAQGSQQTDAVVINADVYP